MPVFKTFLLLSIFCFSIVSSVFAEDILLFDKANRFYVAEQYDKALTYYVKALESDEKGEYTDLTILLIGKCLKKLGNWEKAEETLGTLMKKYPRSEWADDALLCLSEHYLNKASKQNYLKSIDLLKQIITHFPNRDTAPKAMNKIGECYLNMGEFKKAEQWFNVLLKRTQDTDLLAAAFFNLARIYSSPGFDKKNPEKSIEFLKAILQHHPDYPRLPAVYFALGNIYLELQKYREAFDMFTSVVDKFPDSWYAAFSQSQKLLYHKNLKDYSTLTDEYEKFIKNYPVPPNNLIEHPLPENKSEKSTDNELKIKADHLEYRYFSNVETVWEDIKIIADQALYNSETLTLQCSGHVKLIKSSGLTVTGDYINIFFETQEGFAGGNALLKRKTQDGEKIEKGQTIRFKLN